MFLNFCCCRVSFALNHPIRQILRDEQEKCQPRREGGRGQDGPQPNYSSSTTECCSYLVDILRQTWMYRIDRRVSRETMQTSSRLRTVCHVVWWQSRVCLLASKEDINSIWHFGGISVMLCTAVNDGINLLSSCSCLYEYYYGEEAGGTSIVGTPDDIGWDIEWDTAG